MSKSEIAAFLVMIVFVAGGFLLLAGGGSPQENNNKETSSESSSDRATVAACDILTLDIAKKVLGNTAEKPKDATMADASSDDIAVTQCLFQTSASDAENLGDQKQASLLARSAKTDAGAATNREVFDVRVRPAGVETVEGYGESAFWNPEFGQLNILKGGNWFILQVGGGIPSERTLDEARALADRIKNNL